jgi:hypothetical protein
MRSTVSPVRPAADLAVDSSGRGPVNGRTAADQHSVGSRSLAGPSALRCACFIAVLKLALRAGGTARVLRWIRARHADCIVECEGDGAASLTGECIAPMAIPPVVTKTEHAVAIAAALYPGRALCLERSLTLYYYLRRAGVDARFRLGAQPYPFEAHAWVEYAGEPVNDFREHIVPFIPLPDSFG